jgi:membrane fusion protein (multidrug efflux system)
MNCSFRTYLTGSAAAVAVVSLCILCVITAGCTKQHKSNAPAATEVETIPVKIETVKSRDVSEYLDYVANIKAQEEVLVFPRVTGKIVKKVKEEGDLVAKGDVIAYIDRDETGLTFEQAPVESPLSGIVGKVYVDIGGNVTTQTAVALVVDMDKVKVYLDVPEKYLTRVTTGMHAAITVDAYPDQVFDGVVNRISPVLDTATRTAQTEIGIENKDHRLRSGMYAKVKIVIQEYKNAVVVLKEAVLGKEPRQYVYAVKDQKAILKEISVGAREGSYLVITRGISQGDDVVIMGQQRLYDGAPVSVEKNVQ